jgi:hypothetical protein
MDDKTIPKNAKTTKIYVTGEVEPEDLEPLQTSIKNFLNEKMTLELSPENILASEGMVVSGSTEDAIPILEKIPKLPLSFIYTVESENVKTVKTREEQKNRVDSQARIDIPKQAIDYVAGKSDPQPYIADVMTKFYEKLYNTPIDYTNPKTKTKEQKTLKEMIDCNQSGQCGIEFDISFDKLYVISSASNTWTGDDVLDFSHDNDGTEVEYWNSLDKIGNNLKNQQLAKARGDKMGTAVYAKLKQNPDLIIPEDPQDLIEAEYRVTDTGGKIDKSRTLPNPGQYCEFTVFLNITTYATNVLPAVSEMSGKLSNQCIRLEYIGGRKKMGMDLDFWIDINFEWGGGMKAQYVDGNKHFGWMRMSKHKRRRKTTHRQGVRSGSHVKQPKHKNFRKK